MSGFDKKIFIPRRMQSAYSFFLLLLNSWLVCLLYNKGISLYFEYGCVFCCDMKSVEPTFYLAHVPIEVVIHTQSKFHSHYVLASL